MGLGSGRAEGLTILVHLINHLLQLLRCGVLAQHPHHLAQFFGADAAVLSTQHEDVKGCFELCVQWERGSRVARAQQPGPQKARPLELPANLPTSF